MPVEGFNKRMVNFAEPLELIPTKIVNGRRDIMFSVTSLGGGAAILTTLQINLAFPEQMFR